MMSDEAYEAQPVDVRGMASDGHERFVVSFARIDGRCVPLALYEANTWPLSGGTTNQPKSKRALDFRPIPRQFLDTVKQMAWRYLRRGRDGGKRPATATVVNWLKGATVFLTWLDDRGVARLQDVSPLVCIQYVEAQKSILSRYGKPLKRGALAHRFFAVEAIYELSQKTDDPMQLPPWPDTSAKRLAGVTDGGPYKGMTPRIPDSVFCALFQAAWDIVQKGNHWLDLRDGLDRIDVEYGHLTRMPIKTRKNRFLADSGWHDGLRAFNNQLLALRTACYIVVASLSGCRNHELAYLQNDPCYSTTDDDGTVFWWMKSRSDKTGEGYAEWMIPVAAVQALKVQERWAEPYQASLEAEISRLRQANPEDSEIAEAMKHRGALFLGESSHHKNQVRTLSDQWWGQALKDFALSLGLQWNLASHQFRLTFAHYAARSRFGDLRYLKEHFKHWSMDMTLGYALNDTQDMDLYLEIEAELDDIKVDLVGEWLKDDVPLAGGFGTNIVAWRGTNPITLFKDNASMIRSIADSVSLRSALHAWCTADKGGCVGLGIDKLRCTDCDNAVIHQRHAHVYVRQYRDLKALLNLNDIGEVGLNRVRNGIEKCRMTLERLGIDPETEIGKLAAEAVT
ncbi:hypothetical protein RHDC3_00991 [Rhodocyclaceae bacterium]|nr:hypothetical protein RHDC3_00991 [Rhodocyclaceae bacterium]